MINTLNNNIKHLNTYFITSFQVHRGNRKMMSSTKTNTQYSQLNKLKLHFLKHIFKSKDEQKKKVNKLVAFLLKKCKLI